MPLRRRTTLLHATLAACLLSAGTGCFLLRGPDKANTQLRKQKQELEARVAELDTKANADAAMIRSLQERRGTLPTLPQDRLAKLFTTHDLQLGRLTGGADLDRDKPGDEGLKVYATPVDAAGDAIKAAGAFTVEAFDLSRPAGPKIGAWTVGVDEARQRWQGVLNRYNYVLTLPWQTPPGRPDLHVEITFVDELTQAAFKKSVDVKVKPPDEPAPAPAAPE